MIDMPLSPGLALWLRELGHDAVHASQVEMATAEDDRIVAHAEEEGRIVITADLDFARIIALTKRSNPGLILFRVGNYSEQTARDRLARVLEAVDASELECSAVIVDKHRLRIRKLPI